MILRDGVVGVGLKSWRRKVGNEGVVRGVGGVNGVGGVRIMGRSGGVGRMWW